MTENPEESGTVAAPVFVEDLFLTEMFLIKGRLQHKQKRLTNLLEDYTLSFLAVRDATLVSLRSNEVIRTPSVMVNVDRVILAHELVDVAGDEGMRRLAANDKSSKIRAFYSGVTQFEISGQIEPGAYDLHHPRICKYFIVQKPVVRGIDLAHPELALLKSLDYAIVRSDRMAYIYDFG
ncbi:MAG TPA: hypothetical protein VF384_18985 [Planctomycetota bacterium]